MGGLAFPSLDSAIANIEGFGKPGTIATRQNNPGNLISGPFSEKYGGAATPGSSIATFPTVTQGIAAEDALIQHYANEGMTIQEMMNHWAPGSIPGNDPVAYASSIGASTGTTPSTPVAQTGSSNPFGWPEPQNDLSSQAVSPGDLAKKAVTATFGGLSLSRIAAFVLGLICIAGAIFLFKPAQEVVMNTARAAAL